MLQIPKNVMQIGESNPHCKIYMEDYVHTFLERRKDDEIYLAFGKKEEQDNVLYYMIYGVEKKTDWDRGSLPYFKKYERIGTLEGTPQKRLFRPIRGAATALDGYFVFYEQNEDMQAYMITVREKEEAQRETEQEAVLEAVRARRELRRSTQDESIVKKEAQHQENVRQNRLRSEDGERRIALQRQALNSGSPSTSVLQKIRRQFLEKPGRKPVETVRRRDPRRYSYKGRKKGHVWTIPEICRAASLVLLLVLVVSGLTSLNRYSDMKAVSTLFGDALQEEGQGEARRDEGMESDAQGSMVVEETTVSPGVDDGQKATIATDTAMEEIPASPGTIEWTVGQAESQSEESTVKEQSQPIETKVQAQEETQENIQKDKDVANQPENQEAQKEEQMGEEEEETATQALARPESYVVKKGDSLAEICRRFYGDTSRLREICSINQIENPDRIQPGQNILLP